MSIRGGRCFTCLKSDRKKFIDINTLDIDNITYLHKLESCVSMELVHEDNMELCWVCVRHLRITYNFRKMVLNSQEIVKEAATIASDNLEQSSDYGDLIKNEEMDDDELILIAAKVEGDARLKTEFTYQTNDSRDGRDKLWQVKESTTALNKPELDKDPTKKTREKHSRLELSIKCEYCAMTFNKNWKLQKHMGRVHNKIRRHVCSYCEKEFKQSCHLKEHLSSHTGEKSFSCPLCDKKFQRMSSQKRHMRSHDAPPGQKTKRTPFLCTVCGKSFPFSNGLHRHMRTHFGIRNYECFFCKRKFAQSTHLHVHMRTHTGEKPYICDVCGEKFSLKAGLLKHVNKHQYNARA